MLVSRTKKISIKNRFVREVKKPEVTIKKVRISHNLFWGNPKKNTDKNHTCAENINNTKMCKSENWNIPKTRSMNEFSEEDINYLKKETRMMLLS